MVELFNYQPLFPGANELEQLEEILKIAESPDRQKSFEAVQNNISSDESEILSRISSEKIMKSLDVANQMSAALASQRDRFTMEEWKNEYDAMQFKARNEYQERVKEFSKKEEKSKTLKGKIFSFIKKNQTVDPDDFKPNASNYQKFLIRSDSQLMYEKSRLQVFNENIKKVLRSKAVTFMLIGAPVLAFYSLPFAYDQNETLKQVEALSFVYENIIPDVLKDHAYRVPLIASTVIQIAIIPLVYLSAWSFKNTINLHF